MIGVCGMRLADPDHRIVSEPIASGSFLESGPDETFVNLTCLLILLHWHRHTNAR